MPDGQTPLLRLWWFLQESMLGGAASGGPFFAVVGVAGVLVLFWWLRLPYARVPYFDDELGYFVPHALRAFDSGAPLVTLLSGYAWHPPLFETTLLLFWKVGGYSLEGTRSFLVFVAALTIVLTALLGYRLAGWRVAVGAALLLAVCPPFFFHGTSATPEALVTPLLLAALSALVCGYPLAAALATALASLAKPTAILMTAVLVLAVCLAAGTSQQSRATAHRDMLLALFVPISALLAWWTAQQLVPDVVVVSTETGRFEDSQIGNMLQRLGQPRDLLARLFVRTAQLLYFDFRWMATFAVIAWGVVAIRRAGRSRRGLTVLVPRLLPWITLISVVGLHIVVYAVAGIDALPRYLTPALPALLLLTAAAVARLRGLWAPTLVLLVTLFLLSHGHGVYRMGPYQMGALNDHATYLPVVAAYRAAFAYVDLRHAGATAVANYPASAMASDPRLGYTRLGYAVAASSSMHSVLDLPCGGFFVGGNQLTKLPAWTTQGLPASTRRFGAGPAEVLVIEGDTATCREGSRHSQ